MIRLSICIPTYNFGDFIGETLDSIAVNLTEGVEVVILDGGSTDDTPLIVAQKQQQFPQIKYHPQGFRGGIDRDIAKVVSLAHGDYVWLFSADDIMKSGAVAKVLAATQSNRDVYLCEQTLCTLQMETIKEHPIFTNISTPTIFDLGKADDRKKYFSDARTSEAFFSFLSGPIFRRNLWAKADGIPDSFYETCWGLSGRLLSLVPEGLVVEYLAENLLYKRGENDSFMENGVVKRLEISVDGFAHIAETIFGKDSEETYHMRRVIRNERPLIHLLFIKLQVLTSAQKKDIAELYSVVLRHYSNAGMMNMCKYYLFRFIPVSGLNFLFFLKKILNEYRSLRRAKDPG
jgi:abequosyltransferase